MCALSKARLTRLICDADLLYTENDTGTRHRLTVVLFRRIIRISLFGDIDFLCMFHTTNLLSFKDFIHYGSNYMLSIS